MNLQFYLIQNYKCICLVYMLDDLCFWILVWVRSKWDCTSLLNFWFLSCTCKNMKATFSKFKWSVNFLINYKSILTWIVHSGYVVCYASRSKVCNFCPCISQSFGWYIILTSCPIVFSNIILTRIIGWYIMRDLYWNHHAKARTWYW